MCFLPEKEGGEELSSPQPLTPHHHSRHQGSGVKDSCGQFPTTLGALVSICLDCRATGAMISRGAPHETGFIKGFPRCVCQEGATDLHLEKGPALLFIRVSIIETIEGNFVDRNTFRKDVAIISL